MGVVTKVNAVGPEARPGESPANGSPNRAAAAQDSMQRNLFTYIWRHSRLEQLVILSLVVLAQVFYFMSLTVPKSIVNNGITGNAFKHHHTIPFLVWELDLSAIFPGKVIRILDGFQVDQLFSQFVQRPVARRVAVDFQPGRLDGRIGPGRLGPVGG